MGTAIRIDHRDGTSEEYEKCLAHEPFGGHIYLENLDPTRTLLINVNGARYAELDPGVAITVSVDADSAIVMELEA
jgi:hypothetical protein